MKKLISFLSAAAMVVVLSSSTSATSNNQYSNNVITENVITEPEGLGCKLYDVNGNLMFSCFICNCSKVIEAFK
jgi:hypothetical protein